MQVKFDSLNRFEVPKFYLCSPGSIYNDGVLTNILGCLSDTTDEELVMNFNATSELNFRAYQIKRDDPEENDYTMKLYRSLQNRRLIFVEDVGYFVIKNVENGYSDGVHYKDIRAASCETEIESKMLTYVEDGTYVFTELMHRIITSIPLWTMGHVDDSVSERYRTFTDVDTELNTLAFLLDNMQEAYECIFVFDTIHRKIHVYDQNDYVLQTQIHLTKDDVINSVTISEDSNNLYTAIRVQGDENLNISPINPLGANVIYNFDYYLDWMTPGLKESVLEWKELIDSKKDDYYNLNLRYYEGLTAQSDLQLELDKLNTQLTMYRRCRENIVAEGGTSSVESYNKVIEESDGTPIDIQEEMADTLAVIDDLISETETRYEGVKAELDTVTSQIESIKESISTIRSEVSISSYFSDEEYDELYNYIFEGSYNDEYITVTDIMTYSEKFSQMKLLYERAIAQLTRASCPTQEFSVDVENFIFAKRFEEWSKQLETGCLINVELGESDVAMLFLSNITVNYDDNTLSLTFGNRFNKFDAKSLFDDVLGNINKSSNTLDYIKDIVEPIKNGELSAMKEALDTSRTLTKNAALSSTNEEVIIDDTGYTGRRLLSSGLYDTRQVKIVANSMVFTNDAWQTCKVALGEINLGDGSTAYGINAETIMGNMIIGNHLHIMDSDGRDLLTVVDESISAKVSQTGGDNQSFGWSLLSDGFTLTSSGNPVFHASASGVEVYGKIIATEGVIGGCRINEKGELRVPATYIDDLDVSNLTASNIIVKDADGATLLSAGNNEVSIGGWSVDGNSLYSGSSFSSADCFLCTGSASSMTIGGSGLISGWVFKAGDSFGVTDSGALYADDVHLTGRIVTTSISCYCSESSSSPLFYVSDDESYGKIGGWDFSRSGLSHTYSDDILGSVVVVLKPDRLEIRHSGSTYTKPWIDLVA